MSKQKLNDKHCVRCNREEPTPYLRKYWELMNPDGSLDLNIIDLGCGNGRNSNYLRWSKGCRAVYPVDMVGDYGLKITLGRERLPFADSSVDIILANYLLMFLNQQERTQVIREIKRITKPGGWVMVELYPAKDSHAPTGRKMLKIQHDMFKQLGWTKLRYSKSRFIVKKGKK